MSIMESRKRPIGTASEEQPAKTICTRESIEHEVTRDTQRIYAPGSY